MSDFFLVMGLPLLTLFLLTAIYVYFGIHIVRRGVIFVDLALAQVAAMGSTVALLLGIPLESQASHLFSLAFAFLGAVIFTFSRAREETVPQEAIIGVVYAFAAAATVLLVDKAPHGAEHIKYLLVGNILWVDRATITRLSIVVLGVSLFHFFFRHNFTVVSLNPAAARVSSVPVVVWDLLFYLSLAWVVTASVQAAGVLLIFSLLIVPATCGLLLSRSFRVNLILGWLMGAGVSFVGSLLSYLGDLPTGATVICALGITLILTGAVRKALLHWKLSTLTARAQ